MTLSKSDRVEFNLDIEDNKPKVRNMKKWLTVGGVLATVALLGVTNLNSASPEPQIQQETDIVYRNKGSKKILNTPAAELYEESEVITGSSLRRSNEGGPGYRSVARVLGPKSAKSSSRYRSSIVRTYIIYQVSAYQPSNASDYKPSNVTTSSTTTSSTTTSSTTPEPKSSTTDKGLPPKNPKAKSTSSLTPSKNPNGTRALLSWRNLAEHDDAGFFEEVIAVTAEDEQIMQGESPCDVIGKFEDSLEMRHKCASYLSLPYIMPNCTTTEEHKVPKIYHSVGHGSTQSYHQLATSAANPDFVRNHLGDLEALEYVREKCGQEAAEAYECLAAPAYRGDLFRFCALYSEGGIYLDEDIFPLAPLEELYSPCASATIGHDFPYFGTPSKQMKILAGAPGTPIFKCAMDSVITHVRERAYPEGNPLEVSGPNMLHKCYVKHSENVAVSYHDTRNGRYPYSGMRRGNKILAYEVPGEQRHMLFNDPLDYAVLFYQRKIYRDTCSLKRDIKFPSVADRVGYYMGKWYMKQEVDSEDLCKSIEFYDPEDDDEDESEDESIMSIRPYFYKKNSLSPKEDFNSTLNYLVPRLSDPENDPLLLHYTKDTPGLLYEFPVFVSTRMRDEMSDETVKTRERLPLIAPLQADVMFGPLYQVEDNDMPWEKKEDTLVYTEIPDHDAPIVAVTEDSMQAQLGHKYVMSLIERDVAYDLIWKLYSNSVVFMREPWAVSWAMEDRLIPYYHYVPLGEDLSDLDEKIKWCKEHDDECKSIAQKGKEYVENLWMSEKAQSETAEILDTLMRRYQEYYGDHLRKCQESSSSSTDL